MAGKSKDDKDSASLGAEVEKYSRQIWLAGLGAYSKISKDGVKLFETLVADGEKAEAQVKSTVAKPLKGMKDSTEGARSKVSSVKDLALGKWSELEEAFDKRLNKAISRLGVPSRLEVQELHAKVAELTKQLEQLSGVAAGSVKPAPKHVAKPAPKAAAKKPAAKKLEKAPAKALAKPKAAAEKPAPVKKAPKPAVKKVEPSLDVVAPAPTVEPQTPTAELA